MAFDPDSTDNVTVRRFYGVMSSLWAKIKAKIPAPSTTTPIVDGTATKGTDAGYARGDHVHPTDTSREAASNKKTTLNASSNTEFPTSKAVATFVNSSIATATANFLGTYDVVADLGLTTSATNAQIATALGSHTWPSGVSPTNNDYVFVSVDDPGTTTTSAEYRRFKYDGSAWEYEYTLNNSSFTQAQWDAINSGVTATFVANAVTGVKGSSESTYRTGQVSISKSNVGLGSVVNTGDSATPEPNGTTKFTTGGAYTELAKKAPNDHSSTATTYGVGTTANYGHVKLDNSTPLTVGTSNSDGVATGKAHIHNAIESVKRGDVTTADLEHIVSPASRAHMVFSQITSSTSTTHDPGDGYMLSFMWDGNSSAAYDTQIYIPSDTNTAVSEKGRLKIRYRNNSSWGDWGYIPLASQCTPLTSSNNLDNIKGSIAGQVLGFNWSSNSSPSNAPVSSATSMMLVYQPHASYCYQAVITAQDGIYRRICKSGTWTAWTKDLDAADIATGSANGTISVAGTDVAVKGWSSKADAASITGATKCKITYNSQGIVTAGADLAASDIPNLDAGKITSGNFALARMPKLLYNCGYASTRMNSAPAYDSTTPYQLIGKCTYTTAANRTAWERFLLMYADTLFEFKLNGSWGTGSTGPSLTIRPISVYGTTLENTKARFYPRYSFTQNSETGLVIEFYVKFTGDWQNFRLYQLPAQSGDVGATEFNAFTMSKNATAIATLPNTAIDFYDDDDKVTVFGHISTADKATSDSDGNTINSTYLKLSGGTMTGKINAWASQYNDDGTTGAIDMKNSNIVGLNSIYTADASDGASEGIHFFRATGKYDTLWMNSGHIYFVPNRDVGTSTSAADSKKVAILPASITSNQMVVTDGTSGDVKGVDAYTGRGVIAAVGIADGRRNRGNASGDGWGKVASINKSSGISNTNISGVWRIVCNTTSTNSVYTLKINIRGTPGSLPTTQLCKMYGTDNFNSARFGIKLVIRGTSAGNVTAEIWACTKTDYTGIVISELASGEMEMGNTRKWTYYTVSGGGEAAPVADTANEIQVVDPLIDTYSWNHFYNDYKEVTFESSVTVATFLSNAQTANSFANKVFGEGLTDTAQITINAIGRLNISNNTSIQTELEELGGYPMFHVVATRQAGYVEFESSGKKVRYHFTKNGALTNKYYEFVKLNNSVSATPSFYAPTSGGTANYVLIGNGTTSAPTWAEKAPKASAADTAAKIATSAKIGDTNKPVYVAADGTITAISYTIATSVPSGAVFTDTKQNITLATTTKAFITGVSTTPTATAQALVGLADTGVYLTTTAGELNATQFKVNEHCTMQYNSTKSSLDFVFS